MGKLPKPSVKSEAPPLPSPELIRDTHFLRDPG